MRTAHLLRTQLAAGLVAIAGGAAFAAGAPPIPTGPVDVTLPNLLAPMVVDGRLQGYAYLTLSLVPASQGQVLPIREKVHFLQDAMIRELNRGPISKPEEPTAVDVEAVKERLMARVHEILPAQAVTDLKFDRIDFAPLKPQ
jgi:hypothetical protein